MEDVAIPFARTACKISTTRLLSATLASPRRRPLDVSLNELDGTVGCRLVTLCVEAPVNP